MIEREDIGLRNKIKILWKDKYDQISFSWLKIEISLSTWELRFYSILIFITIRIQKLFVFEIMEYTISISSKKWWWIEGVHKVKNHSTCCKLSVTLTIYINWKFK